MNAGEFICLKSDLCIVIETRHSKPGKHVMKTLITGKSLKTDKKYEEIFRFEEPIVILFPEFLTCEVLDIDEDDMVTFVDANSQLKEVRL